jgi:hypothetical protein
MNQHLKDEPAVPFGESLEQAQVEKTPQTKIRTPEEIAFTAQELEKNISRLSQNAPLSGNQSAQNFDALDYASFSLSSSRRAENQAPLREPAETDPYINPSELAKSQATGRPDSDTRSLTPDAESRLPERTSPDEVSVPPSELHNSTARPASHVEITETTTARPTNNALEDFDNMQIHEELPPVIWFSDPSPIITPHSPTKPSPRPQSVVSNLKPESNEQFYDIRNFSDSASGKIELIRGAYKADLEYWNSQPLASQPRPTEQATSEIEQKNSEDIFEKDEVFLARTGDIIQVKGEDGFDRIDLACYGISCASISANSIRIDDEQNGSFEIHFVDIAYAIFANGVKVQLDNSH